MDLLKNNKNWSSDEDNQTTEQRTVADERVDDNIPIVCGSCPDDSIIDLWFRNSDFDNDAIDIEIAPLYGPPPSDNE